MKRITILVALTAAMGFSFAGTAGAVTIGGVDVGTIDIVKCADSPGPSGSATELAFVRNCVGDQTLTLSAQFTTATIISEGSLHYIDVNPNEPGVFLLKFGGNDNVINDTFLFTNEQFLRYLSWSDDDIWANLGCTPNPDQKPDLCKFGGLSHYSYGIDTSSSSGGEPPSSGTVPESGSTLTLLGLGLLGIGFMRRRQAH